MIIVTSLLLGMAFGAAGLVAKQINSSIGEQIADRRIHLYLTGLGSVSNLILPIAAVALAGVFQGLSGVCMAVLGLVAGAIGLGMMRPSYSTKLLLAVVGVPACAGLFLSML